ncbi:MAG: divergent polysaccharide deacetylase family protein [Alphaproteobacteria bacterium]|nr:divergent polysaccharide deacetylase family protein [Alphaproteobacteria bacterium]MDE2630010.1 divergent polysaccharide deacetylase family protein [Alphaproteobacteria bacterium]
MTGGVSSPESVRRGAQALALAYVLVFAVLFGIAGGVAFLGDPHAGDPVAQLDLHLKRVARAVPPKQPPPAQAPVIAPTAPPLEPAPPPAGVQPPAAEQPAAPPPPVSTGRVAIADPALIEKTPQGPLPRIADDGTPPMRAYAAPVVSTGKPRIAIVINGLGISAKATTAALDGLPSGITLAFVPYTTDVQRWVAAARQKGHEVLLEVPMEPYDFPDSDPGQYTLRAGVGEDSNTRRLVWALTRFTGYTGVTNLLGGRFLSDAAALEPVMTYLTRRGLLFYDNGLALHSVAPDIAQRLGANFAQATDTIDAIQSAMEIDHRLSGLEAVARAKGSASGSGFLYPVTVDRVNKWAQGLSGRGFVLVPVSAIVSQSKQ